MEGYLELKQGVFNRWRKRFFRFDAASRSFTWCNDEKDDRHGGAIIATSCTVFPPRPKKREFRFDVAGIDRGMKAVTVELSAFNTQEVEKWLKWLTANGVETRSVSMHKRAAELTKHVKAGPGKQRMLKRLSFSKSLGATPSDSGATPLRLNEVETPNTWVGSPVSETLSSAESPDSVQKCLFGGLSSEDSPKRVPTAGLRIEESGYQLDQPEKDNKIAELVGRCIELKSQRAVLYAAHALKKGAESNGTAGGKKAPVVSQELNARIIDNLVRAIKHPTRSQEAQVQRRQRLSKVAEQAKVLAANTSEQIAAAPRQPLQLRVVQALMEELHLQNSVASAGNRSADATASAVDPRLADSARMGNIMGGGGVGGGGGGGGGGGAGGGGGGGVGGGVGGGGGMLENGICEEEDSKDSKEDDTWMRVEQHSRAEQMTIGSLWEQQFQKDDDDLQALKLIASQIQAAEIAAEEAAAAPAASPAPFVESKDEYAVANWVAGEATARNAVEGTARNAVEATARNAVEATARNAVEGTARNEVEASQTAAEAAGSANMSSNMSSPARGNQHSLSTPPDTPLDTPYSSDAEGCEAEEEAMERARAAVMAAAARIRRVRGRRLRRESEMIQEQEHLEQQELTLANLAVHTSGAQEEGPQQQRRIGSFSSQCSSVQSDAMTIGTWWEQQQLEGEEFDEDGRSDRSMEAVAVAVAAVATSERIGGADSASGRGMAVAAETSIGVEVGVGADVVQSRIRELELRLAEEEAAGTLDDRQRDMAFTREIEQMNIEGWWEQQQEQQWELQQGAQSESAAEAAERAQEAQHFAPAAESTHQGPSLFARIFRW
jgi:hypothetical protein